MFPVLFEIFGYRVSSFGVVLVVAFALGTWIAAVRMREEGLDPELAPTMMVYILVSSVVGAKLYFAVDTWLREGEPLVPLLFASDGITFYGGLVGGALGGYLGVRRHGIPVKAFSQCVAIPCSVGQALGRVGCFLNGDDYGLPTDLPWGVAFPQGSPPVLEPVHPTQLYEALWLLAVSALLWRRRKRSPLLLGEYLALNGLGRFFIEMVRVNPRIGDLTQPQWIGLALLAIGAGLWLHFRGRGSAEA